MDGSGELVILASLYSSVIYHLSWWECTDRFYCFRRDDSRVIQTRSASAANEYLLILDAGIIDDIHKYAPKKFKIQPSNAKI